MAKLIHGKLVVILSDHSGGLSDLVSKHPGLLMCFAEEIVFNAMPAEDCAALLHRQIIAAGIRVKYLKAGAHQRPSPMHFND